MTSTHHLVASSRVEGASVYSADGHKLGKIEDLLIDKASGRAAYALMAFDGILGIGDRFYPIPWSKLDYDPARPGFVAPVTKAEVEQGAPVADREVNDEIEWREAAHSFYGAAPYWQGLS